MELQNYYKKQIKANQDEVFQGDMQTHHPCKKWDLSFDSSHIEIGDVRFNSQTIKITVLYHHERT